MAQFKIENKKLTIEILGVMCEVRKPKFKEIIELEESMAGASTKEKFVQIEKSLVNYGVPPELVSELDSEAMLELLEIINGAKKN